MTEFFHMGGYAFFVWTSYAIVLVLFIYQFISPVVQHRGLKHQLSLDLDSASDAGSGDMVEEQEK